VRKIESLCLSLLFSIHLFFPGITQENYRPDQTSIQKVQLKTGMPLIYVRDSSSRITVLQFSISGGQFAEPLDKSGLAYLTTRLTLVLPDRSKTQTIMDLATQLLMTSYPDYTMVSIACLSQNLEESLTVVAEIMQNPLMSGIRINNHKEQMERQIKSIQDDSENIAAQTAAELLYPGTRYTRSIFGTEKSLKAIKKKVIQKFFDQYFRPSNMTAVVCSDLDMEAIVDLLNHYFTRFPSGEPPSRPEFILPEIQKRTEKIERKTQQILTGLAYRLPPLSRHNYACAHMLEHVLGKGIGSKLWPLREKEKLAYNINARADYFREGGIMEVYLETETGKEDMAKAQLKKTMKQVFSAGIIETEWNSVQNYARAAFLRANETKQQRVQTISFFEMTHLDHSFFLNILDVLKGITRDEFNAFLKEVLNPENSVSIMVGPGISD
jgi:zinc protease